MNIFKVIKLSWISLLLCLSLCLSACGFHLRGAYHFPPRLQNVYVLYAQPFDPLVRKINQSLKTSGMTLASDATRASYIIHITQINQASTLQSTSATNQISTYLLNYTVHFVVTDSSAKVIVPEQAVTSSASYVLNSTEVSGFTEQPQLLFGLQQEVVFQMMSRLSSNNAHRAFL